MLAILGIALTVVGIVAILVRSSDGGGAALVGAGGVLLLFAAFGDQLDSLKYGDLEFVLRRKAEEASREGDFDAAQDLGKAADRLGSRVRASSAAYRSTREQRPFGPERTRDLELLFGQAQRAGVEPGLDLDEVLRLFWAGPEGARVWALGVLSVRPTDVTPRIVLDAVERPDRMFDQYHGLRLARAFIGAPSTSAVARLRVVRAVQALKESGILDQDHDCLYVATQIIEDADRADRKP